MIWNPEYEQMDRERLAQLQARRLKSTVAWTYERVPFYREQMEAAGVSPRDIREVGDVEQAPVHRQDGAS